MLGGAALAGRHSAQRQGAEQDQEARLQALEAQQQPAEPPPPPAPAAAPASPLVEQLKQLSELKDSGALSAEEFDAAKQKLLAS